jgi:hypothetical protein
MSQTSTCVWLKWRITLVDHPMKIKTRKRLIYFLIVLFLIITIFVRFFFLIRSQSENALKQLGIDSTSFSNKPFLEYSKDLSFAKGMDFKIAYYSKTRSPIERFVYINNDVFLYKLPVKSNKPFSEILKIKYIQISPPSGSDYYELTNPYGSTGNDNYYKGRDSYDIIYRVGEPHQGNEINLTLSGTDIKVLKKNDSTFSCYALLGNFSINYNNSDTIDFYGAKKSDTKILSLPIQISFEKKKEHYYMMLILKRE